MLKINNKKKWNIQEAYRQLNELDLFFNKNDLFYCCVGGTLLGCVRHKSLISWDHDLDLLVDAKDMPLIRNELLKFNFHSIVNYKDWEDDSDLLYAVHLIKNGIFTDLFPSSKKDTDLITYSGKFDINKILPLQRVKLKNFYVNIPLQPSEFLKRNYGENWMTRVRKNGRYFNVDPKQLNNKYL